jgi:hypothetical protein
MVEKKGRVRYLEGKPRKPRKLKRDKNITPEEAKDRLSFSAEGGMDAFTQMIMMGFLDHSYAIAAIEQHDVSPSQLIPIYERMQEAWGGNEGMLDYLRLTQNNPAEGRLFAKTMMDDSGKVRERKDQYLWSFDDEYSEADWRKDHEHTLNSASFKVETSQSLLSSIPLSLLAVGTGILASSLVYWNRQRE